jgi:hypothetical protein
MIATAEERAAEAIALLEVTSPVVPAEIPEIHFSEALALAGAQPGEPDLAPAHERSLSDWALHTHGSEFLYVTGFPMRKRPFHTHPEPGRPEYSNSFDLLFRGIELVTGSQAAQVLRLPGRTVRPRALSELSGRLRARHAAARRLRTRSRALNRPAGGRREHPANHAFPA